MGRVLSILWASPNTALGLALCVAGCATGGKVSIRDGVVEAHGGVIGKLLRSRLFRAQALTLGHVVVARGPISMESLRAHERVHVRQYEVLGPFFLLAYALASLHAWLLGKHFYWDNAFEIEARRLSQA